MADQTTDGENTGRKGGNAGFGPVQDRRSPAFRDYDDPSTDNNRYHIPGKRTYNEREADLNNPAKVNR